MAESLAGKLLLATPKLIEPTFRRAVILVCAHTEESALGLVLNRPVHSESVGDHLPALGSLAVTPDVVFEGGPVEPMTALSLGQAISPEPGFAVIGSTGLVELGGANVALGYERVRVFAGYSGWGEGQLDGEVADNAWFIVEGTEQDVYSTEPETLWRRVLQRQRSELSMYAYSPLDSHTN